MLEIDGEPTNGFRDRETFYQYEVRALEAHDSGELIQAYAKWRKSIEDERSVLVWRVRPQFSVQDSDSMQQRTVFTLYCRYAILPIDHNFPLELPVKKEGESPRRAWEFV